MTYKNIGKWSLLTTLLMMIGFVSCTKELRQEVNPVSQEGNTMRVSFPGTSLGSTRAGTFPANMGEKSLSEVWMLTFSDDSGQPSQLINRSRVTLEAGDTETGVKGSFVLRNTGKIHLVAVANLKISDNEWKEMDGKLFREIAKTVVSQPAGIANAFVMTSEPISISIPDENNGSLTFHLKRLSVRVDVINETTVEKGRFEFLGARLKGYNPRSFLFEGDKIPNNNLVKDEGDNSSYNELKYMNYVEDIDSEGRLLGKLYTYEDIPNHLQLEVKGIYNGVKSEFLIPFNAHEINRNTRFLVKLRNSADPTKIAAEIFAVKDWYEGDNASFEPGVDSDKPILMAVKAVGSDGQPLSAPNHTLDSQDVSTLKSIKVNTDAPYYLEFTVTSSNTDPRFIIHKMDAPWLGIEHLSRESKGDHFQHKFKLSLPQNADLFDRSIIVELQNSYLPDQTNPQRFTITQAGAKTSNNPLAWMATSNVGELNQFAPAVGLGGEVSLESLGKVYQAWRNIPFNPTISSVITTNPMKMSLIDPLMWTSEVWYGDMTSFYKFPVTNANGEALTLDPNNWIGAVKLAQEHGAPQSYVGTNGGDPSPEGYHLFDFNELSSIIPAIEDASHETINYNGNVNVMDQVEHKISFNGTLIDEEVKSDYYSKEQGKVYAVRMKTASGRYTTYYKYEMSDSKYGKLLKITARYADGSTPVSVEDVATAAFWADNAGQDVVRYLPAFPLKLSDGRLEGVYYNGMRGTFDILIEKYFNGGNDAVYHHRGSLLRPFKDR